METSQSVSFDLLKHRLRLGDIVTIYNPDPDYAVRRVFVYNVEEDRDKIRCVYLDPQTFSLNIKTEWESVMMRSTEPLARMISNVVHHQIGDMHHYAIVKEDLLVNIMGSRDAMVGKIDNETMKAHKLKHQGHDVRIPCDEDIRMYMEDVICSIGSHVPFDLLFQNCDHWVTQHRYNVGWSRQVEQVIDNNGMGQFVLMSVRDGVPGISHFFRSLAESFNMNSPSGQLIQRMVSECLPWMEQFSKEVAAFGRTLLTTRVTFAYFRTVSVFCASIMAILFWYFSALTDTVVKPRNSLIMSDLELRKLYENTNPYRVFCNMGSVASGVIPRVWNRFVTWLMEFANLILQKLGEKTSQLTSSRMITANNP